MQKGRALLLGSVTASLLALAVIACDDESTSKFPGGGDDAGSTDTGPGFVVDANPGDDGTAPLSCNPNLPGTFAPAWKAPTKASACTAQQLGEYYDACLTTQSADAGDPCKTWTTANAACATCIEPTDNTGPIQWHRDRYYYTLNVAGCLSLERNEPNAGQCPASYAASIECQRAACDGCFGAKGATFQDFQTCQKSAKGSACATYETTFGQICGTTFNDPDGGAYDCFPQPSDANSKVHFVRVEGIFCGQ